MWTFCATIAATLVFFSDAQHSTPIVNVPGVGIVQGSIGRTTWTNRTIYQFHAIPYAQSPTGDLRFQPPVKKSSWSGTLDASKPGIPCPQLSTLYVNEENEDCLTLSVFSNNMDTVRPVMVYVHGGWFFLGGAMPHGPDYLLEGDIVLVVIQYRLGPLGFLSTLSEKIPGNVGILDVIAALEWVQDHIGYFGGNNTQVTVFGESAGSAAVSALLHSPLVQQRPVPLFNRAILQSGSVFSPWAMCETPVEGAYDIARRVGCSGTAVEQCLQETSVKGLLEAFEAHRNETIVKQGYPYVAGTTVVVGGPSGVFPSHPKNYLWNAAKGIAVMGGTTSQEGLFLLDEIVQLQPEVLTSLNSSHDLLQIIRLVQEKFGQTKLDGVLEGDAISNHFLVSEVDQAQWKNVVFGITDICGNHGIKGPVLTDIHAFSRINPENVYLYSFDYSNLWMERNLTFPFPHDGPVHHSEDLLYLFPLSSGLKPKDVKVAKMMVQLWTSFAISGIPSAKDAPYWPPADRLYGPYLSINEKTQQKRYYLNEFYATSEKYRSIGSSSSRFTLSSLCFVFILVLKIGI